jgi:hypothetical protein
MRRPAIRLVLAAVATSFLAACAELPTSPRTPQAPRLDGAALTDSSADSLSTRASNHQGSQL